MSTSEWLTKENSKPKPQIYKKIKHCFNKFHSKFSTTDKICLLSLKFFFLRNIEQSSVLEPWFSNFNIPSDRDLFNMPSWLWLGSSEGGAEILHFYKFPGDFGAVGLWNTFLAVRFKRLSEVLVVKIRCWSRGIMFQLMQDEKVSEISL